MALHSHKAGKIRVTGPRVNGKQAQTYFAPDDPRAEILEAKVQREIAKTAKQKLLKSVPKDNANTIYDTNTGVDGIRMLIEDGRGISGTPRPYLSLQVTDVITNSPVRMKRRVTVENLWRVWNEMLIAAAKARGIGAVPKHWRTRNPPNRNRYFKLARVMHRNKALGPGFEFS